VSTGSEPPRRFPNEFDDEFAVGPEEGNRAFFGTDVLRGLVDGIDDFIHLSQERWRQFRSLGPALLGCSIWLDDDDLIAKLAELSGASIVITKQGRKAHHLSRLEPLRLLNESTPGLPVRAFPAFGDLASKVGGRPAIIGPYDRMGEGAVETVRTLGYRKRSRSERTLPPIIHAKLALLGHLWWHDEGPLGHPDDVVGFTARRLWVSSANFTKSSRRSLEFGYWTEDAALLAGAERFLETLLASSEELDPDADAFDPEFARVEFDDAAMAEAAAETYWDDEDEPDGPD
jgi:hypothetical protein